jgi:hypothetical protein
MPGIELISTRGRLSGTTKIGMIRSAGFSEVSRTMSRNAAEVRRRRGRFESRFVAHSADGGIEIVVIFPKVSVNVFERTAFRTEPPPRPFVRAVTAEPAIADRAALQHLRFARVATMGADPFRKLVHCSPVRLLAVGYWPMAVARSSR